MKEQLKKTVIPDWFKPGLEFVSAWIAKGDNICTVISISEENNTVEVNVNTKTTVFTEDNWHLQHTINGFQNGDYKKLPVTPIKNLVMDAIGKIKH